MRESCTYGSARGAASNGGPYRNQRREFITLLGGAAAWPVAARAQQAGKRPIVGFLGDSTPLAESERAAAFARRLHDLGWIEGRTIAIENRWADGSLPPVCGMHLLSDSNYN